MSDVRLVPLSFAEIPERVMRERSESFLGLMRQRRTVRSFSNRTVPEDIIRNCLAAAGTAPSGANMQPWHFVAVTDSEVKQRIRAAAEKEEHEFYHGRAPQEWLDALAPLGTDEFKPYLETAPYLIAIFSETYGELPDGRKVKNYYVSESAGIATGILITALHNAGLATLTHTPSPMGFLNEILERPRNERPYLVLVVGYPEAGATVPDISKKSLDEIATFR